MLLHYLFDVLFFFIHDTATTEINTYCHTLSLHDAPSDLAAKAKEFISGMLGRAAEKGRMTPEAMQKAVGNVQVVDSIEALADCDVVVEAIEIGRAHV